MIPHSALITGATSGIGEALAHLLAQKGLKLILTGRDETKLQTLASLGKTLTLDLADKKQRQQLVILLHDHPPDLIINNAGFGLYGNCLDLPLKEQLEMIEVNVAATVELSIEAARSLIKAKKPGTILNIASAVAFFTFPTCNLYASSKTFIKNFSLALDSELKSQGVRVLVACPGQVATAFRQRAGRGHPQIGHQLTLSPEKAALALWKQIQDQKPLKIFDWHYQWLVTLSHLLPRIIIEKILTKSIRNRY